MNARTISDPFTMELRLCDDTGMVSHERVESGAPGTTVDPELTYLKLLNNLRARNGNPDSREAITEPFTCTGTAHLAGQHIRCTSPAHSSPRTLPGAICRNGYCPVCSDSLLTTHLGLFCARCDELRTMVDKAR